MKHITSNQPDTVVTFGLPGKNYGPLLVKGRRETKFGIGRLGVTFSWRNK